MPARLPHPEPWTRLQPILETIRLYQELGVWLEVTTLVIPGLNDSDAELTGIATFLSDLDPVIVPGEAGQPP